LSLGDALNGLRPTVNTDITNGPYTAVQCERLVVLFSDLADPSYEINLT